MLKFCQIHFPNHISSTATKKIIIFYRVKKRCILMIYNVLHFYFTKYPLYSGDIPYGHAQGIVILH